MDYDLFKKGVDECAENGLYSIRLSWRGESTLNPRLLDMIAYARKAGIKEISFLSNGSALTKEFNMGLIKSGLDYITISVDALRSNYNKLRAPLDYDQTLQNIKLLYTLKEKYGKGFPKIKVQGIYEYFKGKVKTYYTNLMPFTDNISFNVKHDYELRNVDQDDNLFCPYLWQRITVTASGMIPLCISDWDLDIKIGDLNKNTIKEVWNGRKMQTLRKQHLANQRLKLKPCQKCYRTKTATINEVL
jgi:radical SAM protein with 4Fe4S-binding SPASM domain